jgi:cysteine desulfuration protein SufE
MSVPEGLRAIVDLFATSPKQIKVAALVDYADRLPEPPPELAQESLERVVECQTPFHVAAVVDADATARLYFQVPRESPTMRGYAEILRRGLDGLPVAEILDLDDTFYTRMGLAEVVSPLRLRGMSAIIHAIKNQLRSEVG